MHSILLFVDNNNFKIRHDNFFWKFYFYKKYTEKIGNWPDNTEHFKPRQ
jgi:hypothetical protein